MTLTDARALVGEYFHVETPAVADEILCAALRVRCWDEAAKWGRAFDEPDLRKMLASTRALFGHAFKVKV